MLDVLIIGGGVVGTAIARELSRYRLAVALIEKEPDLAMGTTKANSAIVHGGYAEEHSKLKGRLCYQGRKQFAQLDQQLNFGFKAIGSMVLAFDKEDRKKLEAMMENGEKNGLDDLSILPGEEVRHLEPGVSEQVQFALYCQGAGVCSPFELAIALGENAAANGVQVDLGQEVCRIVKKENEFVVQTVKGREYRAKRVVNAAGLQAGRIAALAGDEGVSIHPRSGEYIVFAKSPEPLIHHVLFQMPTEMGKGILFTPTIYGNTMIGPDAIDEIKDDRNTHVERLYHIYRQALYTTNDIPLQRFIRSYAGVRAVSSTDDFVIEESVVAGLIHAAGIQSPGLTSSPAIAEMVRDLLADSGLELLEKEEFNPYREPTFKPHAELEPEEMQPLLALEPGTKGRMICRCEQVLEETVNGAVNRDIPVTTIDGVKRRTRAGMGLCQGNFCRPRVTQLLEAIHGDKVDGKTDAQRDGLVRVSRGEFLEYVKQMEDKA